MTLTIDFPRSVADRLEELSFSGADIPQFVCDAVAAKLAERRSTRLFECLKPIHDETERLGMTESNVEAVVDESIAEVRAETRARPAKRFERSKQLFHFHPST